MQYSLILAYIFTHECTMNILRTPQTRCRCQGFWGGNLDISMNFTNFYLSSGCHTSNTGYSVCIRTARPRLPRAKRPCSVRIPRGPWICLAHLKMGRIQEITGTSGKIWTIIINQVDFCRDLGKDWSSNPRIGRREPFVVETAFTWE